MLDRIINLAVLGSGEGTNFEAIANGIKMNKIKSCLKIVISDIENSGILKRAHKYNIPTQFINVKPSSKGSLCKEDNKRILDILIKNKIDIIALAGFMRIIGNPLLSAFPNRILNIHPSLLPKYKGLKAWEQALKAGEEITGATVHLVNNEIDSGTILAQKSVSILKNDTPEILLKRIHSIEQDIFPASIAKIVDSIRKSSTL